MKIPESTNSTIALIDKYHEKQNEQPPTRYHLGVSMLGEKCDRKLWLSFRWAVRENFEGRILRLFRRGHNEESTIVSDLRAIGVDIRNTTSSQSRVNFGKHVSGSLDGIIESGLPEAPKARHVAEFKTHSKKSFDDLVKKGLKESKPIHWTQLNVYMYGKDIDRGFYLAVNKDSDELYQERIELDKPAAIKAIERGQKITMSDRMPIGLSDDETYYECKFCPNHSFCFKEKLTKEVNCRTCAFSTAKEDSTWHCTRWDDVIPNEAQYLGCDNHVLHPDLVPWDIETAHDEWHAIYIVNGKPILNGADGYHSKELVANPQACDENDRFVESLRSEMGARIIESEGE
jgi:hypothetical protein